jgi:hypothetical protein
MPQSYTCGRLESSSHADGGARAGIESVLDRTCRCRAGRVLGNYGLGQRGARSKGGRVACSRTRHRRSVFLCPTYRLTKPNSCGASTLRVRTPHAGLYGRLNTAYFGGVPAPLLIAAAPAHIRTRSPLPRHRIALVLA